MKYLLGLDIGIASLGYAICSLGEDEKEVTGLIDLGVRTFDKAEHPKTGASLNAKRREFRGRRRLIRRRRIRLIKLKSFLFEKGIIENFDKDNNFIENLPNNPWELRVEALDRKLTNIEFATILIHLLKHRGYKIVRKSELQESKDEKGKLLSSIANNQKELNGRTCAQLALEFLKDSNHIRNKQGQYNHCFGRENLLDEFNKIIDKQQEFNNPIVTDELRDEFIKIFEYQKPALSGDELLKMLGKCTHEKQEYRAAKNTYSVERHVWLTKLNNLRILQYGEERGLTNEEREKLILLPYEKSKLIFKQVRDELKLGEEVVFKVSGKSEDKNTFMELKAFHKIKKVVKDKDQWEVIKNSPALMDAIGTAFSVYKVDDEIQDALEGKDNKFINLLNKVYSDIGNELKKLNKDTIDSLISVLNFDKFSNLSLLSLSKIVPEMEKGKRYDEVVNDLYANNTSNKFDNERYLPVIETQEINNPVVIRALSQARKLINAIIREYGSPSKINIELAREVGKSKKVRDEIDKENKKNEKKNDDLKKEFEKTFGKEPSKKRDFIKYRLYKEQHCKCLYSGESIDIYRLLEKGYVEVDHALPYSRTLDDSLNNKVLVLASENQKKGNKTPYEYFKNDIVKWGKFKVLVESTSFEKYKKSYLLTKKIDEDSFKEKNLNDTKYIARFLKNFIENNLDLSGINNKKVICTNGRITSFLRNNWGLSKNREESDRHHALDACIIACVNDSIIQKVVKYYKNRENKYIKKESLEYKFKDKFPDPWEFFRKEVGIRVFSDNPEQDLQDEIPDRWPLIDKKYLRPLFVSRAAKRNISGALHDQTLRSAKYLSERKISTNRVSIDKLTLKNLEELHDKKRNNKLYELLKTRLENKDTSPLYISEKDELAKRSVRKVTLVSTQESGFYECDKFKKINAIANNATMIRIDIFKNKDKYYAVPIYLWQITLPQAPNISAKGVDVSDFDFQFSLYKNDLVKVDTKGSYFQEIYTKDKESHDQKESYPQEEAFLYYVTLDTSTNQLHLKVHDSNNGSSSKDNEKSKDGESLKEHDYFIRNKFTKNTYNRDKIRYSFQNFKTFEKYDVDILGNKFKVKSEKRKWFPLNKKS